MTEKLQNALNEQITAELWSANLYLSMSFYLKKEGFSGMANWMRKQFISCWNIISCRYIMNGKKKTIRKPGSSTSRTRLRK